MKVPEPLGRLFRRQRGRLRSIERLELHVTHACNLTCDSCSHYSNHNHHGQLTLAEADRWMQSWSRRLAVAEFHLLGGEPTIHPDLPGFVQLARRHWPDAFIRIRTNGFFLHRHPSLPALLAADGRACISIAVHHDSPEYREHLKPIFDLVTRWQSEFGVKVDVDQSFANWTLRYRGFGTTMEPFEDNAPRASWEICPARICKQLYDGKIYKCAPLAYLKMQKAKYDLSPKWDFYLGYEGLDPACSDREFDAFIAKEDEPYCAMCSARRRSLALTIPIRSRQNSTAPVRQN
ncbi:MAG TPA: radical SAM protein [Xanthobacteraceae bacterium]|nr:radical SAM protein [Xanthobacteraceae bacterium]